MSSIRYFFKCVELFPFLNFFYLGLIFSNLAQFVDAPKLTSSSVSSFVLFDLDVAFLVRRGTLVVSLFLELLKSCSLAGALGILVCSTSSVPPLTISWSFCTCSISRSFICCGCSMTGCNCIWANYIVLWMLPYTLWCKGVTGAVWFSSVCTSSSDSHPSTDLFLITFLDWFISFFDLVTSLECLVTFYLENHENQIHWQAAFYRNEPLHSYRYHHVLIAIGIVHTLVLTLAGPCHSLLSFLLKYTLSPVW